MKAIRESQWIAGVALVFLAMLVGVCLAVAGLV
jgi:quinol-cytochrome oxidoreductase complex cytochrome b subunit